MLLFESVFVLSAIPWVLSTASSKRGLVYVSSADNSHDDGIWTESGSDLTWYYTYNSKPASALASSNLQFVPMLWGAPSSPSDTTFLDDVRSQIKGGTNISYALSFNEPDGTQATGGSNVPADLAASTWIREMEPLKADGIKLGAPAVTGAPGGFTWLENFFNACNGGCNPDFIPVHWYGNFEGLAGHLGQVHSTYPNLTIWITEYALAHENLHETQSFFNTSAEYFDRLE